jgi:uncharacterized protein YjbI with pentapeptide repeats
MKKTILARIFPSRNEVRATVAVLCAALFCSSSAFAQVNQSQGTNQSATLPPAKLESLVFPTSHPDSFVSQVRFRRGGVRGGGFRGRRFHGSGFHGSRFHGSRFHGSGFHGRRF